MPNGVTVDVVRTSVQETTDAAGATRPQTVIGSVVISDKMVLKAGPHFEKDQGLKLKRERRCCI